MRGVARLLLAVRRDMRANPEPDMRRAAVAARLTARLWAARERRAWARGDGNDACVLADEARAWGEQMRWFREAVWGHLADDVQVARCRSCGRPDDAGLCERCEEA